MLKRWRLCAAGQQSERERERESVHTHKGIVGSWNWLSQISEPYIVLKLPRDPRGHSSLSRKTLFFIGYGLHQRNFSSPLVTAYTHALLVFR